MFSWTAQQIALITDGTLLRGAEGSPKSFEIDSRKTSAGALFIGLPGERVDGASFAAEVIEAGAFGAIVSKADEQLLGLSNGAVIVHEDPVKALGRLASARIAEIGCKVVMITGSTGKTSTKDITASVLSSAKRTFASRENRNTEIGMPLEVLSAPLDTEVMVLEAAMRGRWQIAELASIGRPDVGLITNIGPVHLELLGSIEAIAAAKAELIGALESGKAAVLPAGEALLEPYLRADLNTTTFGPGGDVRLVSESGRELVLDVCGSEVSVEVGFDQPHNRLNLLAAAAVARAIGVSLPAQIHVNFSALRGQRMEAEDGIVVIDDCYNANPMSMRAALEDLAGESARRGGRKIAVLGDMLELGPDGERFHEETGGVAQALGVDILVTVGELAQLMSRGFAGETHSVADAGEAAQLVPSLIAGGDTVLVKASRGIGLEAVSAAIRGSGV